MIGRDCITVLGCSIRIWFWETWDKKQLSNSKALVFALCSNTVNAKMTESYLFSHHQYRNLLSFITSQSNTTQSITHTWVGVWKDWKTRLHSWHMGWMENGGTWFSLLAAAEYRLAQLHTEVHSLSYGSQWVHLYGSGQCRSLINWE